MNGLVLNPRIKTGFQVFFRLYPHSKRRQQYFYNDNEYNYYTHIQYTFKVFTRYMDRLLRAHTIIIVYHIPYTCACGTHVIECG